MKIVLCEARQKGRVVELENAVSLETMQKLVHGNIAMLYPFHDQTMCMIFNDEGKISCYNEPNRPLLAPDGEIMDIIFGTIVICGLTDDEYFESLTEEQTKEALRMFGTSYVFCKNSITREVCAIPWN